MSRGYRFSVRVLHRRTLSHASYNKSQCPDYTIRHLGRVVNCGYLPGYRHLIILSKEYPHWMKRFRQAVAGCPLASSSVDFSPSGCPFTLNAWTAVYQCQPPNRTWANLGVPVNVRCWKRSGAHECKFGPCTEPPRFPMLLVVLTS